MPVNLLTQIQINDVARSFLRSVIYSSTWKCTRASSLTPAPSRVAPSSLPLRATGTTIYADTIIISLMSANLRAAPCPFTGGTSSTTMSKGTRGSLFRTNLPKNLTWLIKQTFRWKLLSRVSKIQLIWSKMECLKNKSGSEIRSSFRIRYQLARLWKVLALISTKKNI